MMKIRAAFLIVATLVSMAAHARDLARAAIQASSAWTNQRGSTLYIDSVAPNGQLTGHYINRAQGFNCQNIAYPVVGWIYQNAITFTTIWQNPVESCNSITSWTGFYDNGQISTLWQLVVNGSSSTNQILQGSDTFNPSSKVERKTLLQDK